MPTALFRFIYALMLLLPLAAQADDVWQGRNDLAESPEALRLFQTVGQHNEPRPIVLLGFA